MRRLPVLEAIVLEALRLYSPAYMVGRCACRDVVLLGPPGPGGRPATQYRLAAGTTVLVSPYIMHREETVWGHEASQFKPQRWQEIQAR